ncbi:hypothetical protein L1987_86106 [Smallanthus sonchifolius]|uniref:Uncharacterized protein n=1 Tax=Smallanthus sonchifolius TaxID=185202 RepID=A0ACB8XZ10_9ASTR|nr:hypothetical protein L1987_86106 [Smallanthus sonchifolius]
MISQFIAYKVEMINDGMQDFYVQFHGPKDEVSPPSETVPPELPEPTLGINFARAEEIGCSWLQSTVTLGWVLHSTEQFEEIIIAQAGLQKPSNAALTEIAEELLHEFQRCLCANSEIASLDISAIFSRKVIDVCVPFSCVLMFKGEQTYLSTCHHKTGREREAELRRQESRGEKREREIVDQVMKKITGGSPSKKPLASSLPLGARFVGRNISGNPGHNRVDCPELKQGGGEKKIEMLRPKCRAFHISENCKLRAWGETFLIDLIPMFMGDFDVIVGMDWLSKNKENILCGPKATKYMVRWCKAYMACVANVIEKVKDIRDVPVVNQFEDVFPDELSGVPPEREVEFGIDLAGGQSTL